MQASLRWLPAAALLTLGTTAVGSPQEFCDTMESYNVGDFLAGVPDNNGWQMWDLAPLADHEITDARAHSGSQSAVTWGVADLVHGELVPPVTSGIWEGSVWNYIADGTPDELLAGDTAWFLYLSEFTHGGGGTTNTWVVQVTLDGNDTWSIDAGTPGGSTNTGVVATNQWSELKFVADLDNDIIEVFYNGVSMAPPYPLSGGVFGNSNGPVALDIYDMYSPTSGPNSVTYYDDWLLEPQGAGGKACDTPITFYCTAKTGLVCGVPSMTGSGNSSATASSGFSLQAGPARQNRLGIFLYGNTGRANFPFQGGTLCVNPPLRRSVPVNSGGATACGGEFALDFNCFASGNCGGNPQAFLQIPGTLVDSQVWGRDSVATGSFLSDGAEWTIGA